MPTPPPVAPPAIERRRAERRAAQRLLPCRLSGPGGEGPLEAIVLDLSATGAGLLAQGQRDRGDGVALYFDAPGGQPPPGLAAQVARRAEHTPGWSVLGAEFVRPLTAGELGPLLAALNGGAGPLC